VRSRRPFLSGESSVLSTTYGKSCCFLFGPNWFFQISRDYIVQFDPFDADDRIIMQHDLMPVLR
jgi:hypothetical protein